MPEMPKVPCLRRAKSRCWGMRRKVPDGLRAVIGKREVIISYGPVAYLDAIKRHHSEMARITAMFSEAEQRLASGGMTAAVTPEVVGRAAAAVLYQLERQAPPVPFDDLARESRLELAQEDTANGYALPPGDATLQRVAKAAAASVGIVLEAGTQAAWAFEGAIRRAMTEHALRQVDRLELRPARQRDPAFVGVTATTPPAAPAVTVKQAISAYQTRSA